MNKINNLINKFNKKSKKKKEKRTEIERVILIVSIFFQRIKFKHLYILNDIC